jgi:phenylalanine-4-hydroxylase
VILLENVKIFDPQEKVIFEEHQKPYPLFLASNVVSVCGGAGDRKEFALRSGSRTQKVKAHKTNLTAENATLNQFYQTVRTFREEERKDLAALGPLMQELQNHYPQDWLLRLELFELHQKHAPESMATAQLRKSLKTLREQHPDLSDLIQRGIEL